MARKKTPNKTELKLKTVRPEITHPLPKYPETPSRSIDEGSNGLNGSANLTSTYSDAFVFAALTLVCLAVYAQMIRFEFINLDDNLYVYANQFVSKGLTLSGIQWAFTSFDAANWHPLTWISLMIDVSLFGVQPGMMHAVNVLFHLVNSILVFSVFQKLTGAYWPSAISAFLFAAHPTHVESVAWISERKDVLSMLFFLLTIWAYIRYVRQDGGKKKKNYAFMILFFALGLMAKSMLVTIPFVLLLIDYWPLQRLKDKKSVRPLVVEKIPLFVLAIASSILTVLAQSAGGAISPLVYISLSTRIINTIFSYTGYVGMLFYPFNLGIMYPYPTTFSFWLLIFNIVFLISITAFCIWRAKKQKYLIVGWFWFLGTLVPVIGIVQVGSQSLADRYTYIPFIGLVIMLVWGVADIIKKFKLDLRPVIAVTCILIAALSIAAFKQASYWQTPETLYSHTMAVSENNILITDNNCLNFIRQNRIEEANERCKALSGDHNHANGYNTWGIIQVKRENYEEAIKSFQRCISLNPKYPLAYANLAVAQSKIGRLDEGAVNLKNADRTNDGSLSAEELGGNYSLIAVSFMNQKQADKAAPLFARAVEMLPARSDLRTNYGTALSVLGQYDEALVQLNESLKQDPNQAEAYNALGLIYLGQDRKDEALIQFQKALQLNPDLSSAAKNIENISRSSHGGTKSIQ